MDAHTRVVALSHVQVNSGFRIDLAAIGSLCARSGALHRRDELRRAGERRRRSRRQRP